jgi:hypothetical protein
MPTLRLSRPTNIDQKVVLTYLARFLENIGTSSGFRVLYSSQGSPQPIRHPRQWLNDVFVHVLQAFL